MGEPVCEFEAKVLRGKVCSPLPGSLLVLAWERTSQGVGDPGSRQIPCKPCAWYKLIGIVRKRRAGTYNS